MDSQKFMSRSDIMRHADVFRTPKSVKEGIYEYFGRNMVMAARANEKAEVRLVSKQCPVEDVSASAATGNLYLKNTNAKFSNSVNRMPQRQFPGLRWSRDRYGSYGEQQVVEAKRRARVRKADGALV